MLHIVSVQKCEGVKVRRRLCERAVVVFGCAVLLCDAVDICCVKFVRKRRLFKRVIIGAGMRCGRLVAAVLSVRKEFSNHFKALTVEAAVEIWPWVRESGGLQYILAKRRAACNYLNASLRATLV